VFQINSRDLRVEWVQPAPACRICCQPDGATGYANPPGRIPSPECSVVLELPVGFSSFSPLPQEGLNEKPASFRVARPEALRWAWCGARFAKC